MNLPLQVQKAHAIRVLAMDAVQRANSGHPGAPMGMADIAEVLWSDFLQHNPTNPNWVNRDRFILSNGHASMLLYALLHLTGYNLSLEDIKNFRQLHSKTPGHPEYGITPGVETTTGPLGQGLANAVGMALAEKYLNAEFNRPNFPIINHYTYAFVGDGCLMEGISHEVCSLAGTWQLGKLIVFYDDNEISIDGHVSGWFTDNTLKRFAAYGWHVIGPIDGHDSASLRKAIVLAREEYTRPTLICCKTIIGFGAPNKAGSHQCHGSPLGETEVQLVRKKLGWNYPPFEIPTEIYEAWDARSKGQKLEHTWNQLFTAYQKEHPQLAGEFQRRIQKKLPDTWEAISQNFIQKTLGMTTALSTRKASALCLEAYAPSLPELIGGSADLTESNLTRWSKSQLLLPEKMGNYIAYGVREFGMSAMMNGMALYGGLIPFGGTFLTFSDYARNAIRMAALMRAHTIFVYTHDSIGLGEDGPTHQAIEHLSSLRLIPNLALWRPCDVVETAMAWKWALEYTGPTCLVFSRQNIPRQVIQSDSEYPHVIARGGYVCFDCQGTPQAIIIATGSEVPLAVQAAQKLREKNILVRVVSMPSTFVFDQQPLTYRMQVLPEIVTARVAIEAGSTAYWYRYVGLHGKVVGIDRFGDSAPAEQLFSMYGFTVEHLIKTVESVL